MDELESSVYDIESDTIVVDSALLSEVESIYTADELLSNSARLARIAHVMGLKSLAVFGEKSDSTQEFIDQDYRKDCIAELVSTYADDRSVQKAVSRASKRHKIDDPGDIRAALANAMFIYDVLSGEEKKAYFDIIDSGVEACIEAGGVDKLTGDNEKKALELVAAHQILYLSNLRFVFDRAANFYNRNSSVPLEDLMQEGCLGLQEAIRRFDPALGFELLTYAAFWIDRNIRFAYADFSRTIRIPRDKHDAAVRIQVKTDELAVGLGRDPTDEEIAHEVGLSLDEYHKVVLFGSGVLPFDDSMFELEPLQVESEVSEIIDSIAMRQIVSSIISESTITPLSRMVLGTEHDIPGLRNQDSTVIRHDTKQPVDYSGILEAVTLNPEIPQTELSTYFGFSPRRFRAAKTEGVRSLRKAADQLELDPLDIGLNSLDVN